MFAGIVSRDSGEPWGTTGLDSASWLHVPVQELQIGDLIATQPGVYLRPLMEPVLPFGGDPLPHVIHWGGRLYLEDGHHRVVRAVLDGRVSVSARVLVLPLQRVRSAPEEIR